MKAFLEHTTGSHQLEKLRQELVQAEAEQAKHSPGSYYYNLVTRDIQSKQEQLRKYEEQAAHASTNEQLLDLYQRQVLSFLDFLSVMQGRYHEASFKEKRNALVVLGVRVTVSAPPQVEPITRQVETDLEFACLWLLRSVA